MKTFSTVIRHLGFDIEVRGDVYFEEDGSYWDDLEMEYCEGGVVSVSIQDKVYNKALEALDEELKSL